MKFCFKGRILNRLFCVQAYGPLEQSFAGIWKFSAVWLE